VGIKKRRKTAKRAAPPVTPYDKGPGPEKIYDEITETDMRLTMTIFSLRVIPGLRRYSRTRGPQ
jgi:hypothetical protein